MIAQRFANVDTLLTALLRPALAGTATVSNRRDTTLSNLPFVEAYRYGGTDDVRDDSALVSVTVFATRAADAFDIAETCRTLLLNAPASTVGTGRGFDRVTTLSAPVEVPYGDGRVRSWAATYRVTLRPTRV